MFYCKKAFSVFSIAVLVSNFTYASTESCSEMVSSLAKLKYQTLMPAVKLDMAERLQDQRAILTQLKNELTREEEAELIALLKIGKEKRMELARRNYPDLAVTERLDSLREKLMLLKAGVQYSHDWQTPSCPEGIEYFAGECRISENLALSGTKRSQILVKFDEKEEKVEIKACTSRAVRTSDERYNDSVGMAYSCSTISFPGREITGIKSVNDSLMTDQYREDVTYGFPALKQIHGIDLKFSEKAYIENEVSLVCKDECEDKL